MSKRIILYLAALLCTLAASAKPVDPDRVLAVGAAYLPGRQLTVTPLDGLYLVQPADGNGFVLVSGDDSAYPVLAYSLVNSFPALSESPMPPHVADWLDGYRQGLAAVNGDATAEAQSLWNNPKSATRDSIGPLLTTTWNQSPFYNALCPTSNGSHAVTGCVATAQAQVMKYWNHPRRGHGFASYNAIGFGPLSVDLDTAYLWDSMPNALGPWSSDTQIFSVAQLMYHIGVAIHMGYGIHSSGAYTHAYGAYNLPSSERSLRENFGYSPALHNIFKENYSDQDWDSILRLEIDAGRPVLYSGRDSDGGHAFVLDGYVSRSGRLYFHVNWGWGGYCDGFYTIDALEPGSSGIGGNTSNSYTIANAALVGIVPVPPCESDSATIALVANDSHSTVSGSGTYALYDTAIVHAVAAEGYRFDRWSSGNINNPLTFIVWGDFSDTALFVPILSDTVGYCTDDNNNVIRSENSTTSEWGIRIPACARHNRRALTGIEIYVAEQSFLTVNIYVGNMISSVYRRLSHQFDFTQSSGWTAVEFPEPIFIEDTMPVWITVRHNDYRGFPAASSPYCGNPDGSWYNMPQGWTPYSEQGGYYTWMLRGIFAERPCRVSVATAGDLSANCVSGAGDYEVGSLCTVSVNDDCLPNFQYWQLGNGSFTTPELTFPVTSDTVVTAHGTPVGIDTPDADNGINVTVCGRTVSIHNPAGLPVALYDIQGRQLNTTHYTLTATHYTLPSSGIYILKAPYKTEKIIIQ